MKIEVEISDEDLRETIIDKFSDEILKSLLNPNADNYEIDYKERDKRDKEAREKILRKIKWDKAHEMLGETIVKKFFENILDGKK